MGLFETQMLGDEIRCFADLVFPKRQVLRMATACPTVVSELSQNSFIALVEISSPLIRSSR